MLGERRSCVCISGYVKCAVKSYGVKVGAADSGSVVTVPWSFVGRSSTVNLLHSPHTKDCLHLWLLGGGVCRWINNEERAGPRRPFWILSQAGRADDTGHSGDSFVIPAKCNNHFCFNTKEFPQDAISLCHKNHVIQKTGNLHSKIIIFSWGTKKCIELFLFLLTCFHKVFGGWGHFSNCWGSCNPSNKKNNKKLD